MTDEEQRWEEQRALFGTWPGQTFGPGARFRPRQVAPVPIEQVSNPAAGMPADSAARAEAQRHREAIAQQGTWPGQSFG